MERGRSISGWRVLVVVVWKGRSRLKRSDGEGSWDDGEVWSAWRLGEVGGRYDVVRWM